MLTSTTLHDTIPISRTVSVVQQLSATAFYPHGFATMDKTLFVGPLRDWELYKFMSCPHVAESLVYYNRVNE